MYIERKVYSRWTKPISILFNPNFYLKITHTHKITCIFERFRTISQPFVINNYHYTSSKLRLLNVKKTSTTIVSVRRRIRIKIQLFSNFSNTSIDETMKRQQGSTKSCNKQIKKSLAHPVHEKTRLVRWKRRRKRKQIRDVAEKRRARGWGTMGEMLARHVNG